MTTHGLTAVFAGARGRLTAGLLILEGLVAIEIMVVATILPAVQEDLQGLHLYGWNYTALTLASLGTVPIAGRLTDRTGPRPIFAVSIGFCFSSVFGFACSTSFGTSAFFSASGGFGSGALTSF